MRKSLIVLAILSTMSAPVVAQTAAASNQASTAKPQTVKKRVCEQAEEDSYSRLGGRKICHTVEVPVQTPATNGSAGKQAPAPGDATGNHQ